MVAMTALQNKKVRLGIGIAAVALAAAAIGAGTYAAFSDTETGPGGTLKAGTLDLTVGGSGGVTLFTGENIAPGYTSTSTIALTNTGSIPGTLASTLQLTGTDVTCTEPEAEAEGKAQGACAPGGDLQNQLTISILSGPGVAAATPPVTLAKFAETGFGQIPLGAGATGEYVLKFELPNLSGTENNKVQGDRVTLSSNYTLTQS